MIFPNNGKVVIFDDKYPDIASLIKALSKEKVPFLYYQDEGGEDLPSAPIENIRLVFLDLELVANNPEPHRIVSTIAARLRRTIVPKTVYVLIYWSTKEDKYKDVLEKAFEERLKDYKPILKLSLNKSEANAHDNPVRYITEALHKEMHQFSSLNAFMLWESSVNNAAGSITNNLTSVFEHDKDWDKNTYNLLFKIAKAQAGRDTIPQLDNKNRLTTAFELINGGLIDNVEKRFDQNFSLVTINEIKEGGRPMDEREIINLNTKLHLVSGSLNHFYAGNVYIKNLNGIGREIIKKNIKDSKIKDLVEEQTKLVCLDITPSCDYSQWKNYSRVLFGLKFHHVINSKALKDGEFLYRLCPVMDIDGPSYIILDYRYLKSFSKEEFKWHFPDPPKFRLRNGLLLDIQAQFSHHINRPGIVTVE